MSGRASGREIRAGMLIVAVLVALLGLFALATGGPGFLARHHTVDVDFRDGQGIRPGGQVRIAGVDAGRVVSVTLAEVDGVLRARIRISIPDDLAARLRADARITVQASLTGQSRINILSTGRSKEPLPPGKVVAGVETTMFDPVLEQVGLGPGERADISHMIGEVRKAVDESAPKVRKAVDHLEQTVAGLRETSEAVRPVVESTVSKVGDAAQRIAGATPRAEAALGQVVSLTARVDGLLAENRPDIRAVVANIKELSATAKLVANRDHEKLGVLLNHVNDTLGRADLALYNAKQFGDLGLAMLTRNKVDIERTVANVKDITEWGVRLVEKIYANPFVLSPLYKPRPEDIRVQGVYDSAVVFASAAQKLDDAAKTLEVLNSRPNSPQQQQELVNVRRQVAEVTAKLGQMSTQLSEAMQPATRNRRGEATR